jgi:hypothetical protein
VPFPSCLYEGFKRRNSAQSGEYRGKARVRWQDHSQQQCPELGEGVKSANRGNAGLRGRHHRGQVKPTRQRCQPSNSGTCPRNIRQGCLRATTQNRLSEKSLCIKPLLALAGNATGVASSLQWLHAASLRYACSRVGGREEEFVRDRIRLDGRTGRPSRTHRGPCPRFP